MKVPKLFIDSGAFSLFISKTKGELRQFFRSKEFHTYASSYAKFIKKHEQYIDLYANIDVLYDPELSWQNLKYLEGEFGLKPCPVIHYGADLKWIEKHLKEGYNPIALGGMAGKVLRSLKSVKTWLDSVFSLLCPSPSNLPVVKVHGFGVTTHNIVIRYPWWSLDSRAWNLTGACGKIFIPRWRDSGYDYSLPPLSVYVSVSGSKKMLKLDRTEAESRVTKGKSYYHTELKRNNYRLVRRWLDHIGIPMGDATSRGVINYHRYRKLANIIYFQNLINSLPDWPSPFTVPSKVIYKPTTPTGFVNNTVEAQL